VARICSAVRSTIESYQMRPICIRNLLVLKCGACVFCPAARISAPVGAPYRGPCRRSVSGSHRWAENGLDQTVPGGGPEALSVSAFELNAMRRWSCHRREDQPAARRAAHDDVSAWRGFASR